MLDSERLKVNSERWARLHPTALNLVRQTPDRVHLVTNPNGTANLQTTIKGESCYYHSTEDPVAEANGWFNQLNLHGLDVLYVFGLGLGYAWVPRHLVQEELASGALVRLDLAGGSERYLYTYLLTPSTDALGPAAELLLRCLRNEYQADSGK